MRDFYKLFFLWDLLDVTPQRLGPKTIAADFFRPDSLPPLSRGRVLEQDIRTAFLFRDDPTRGMQFD